MSILEKAKLKLGREITKEISNFDAGESISEIAEYMTNLGFKSVKYWYQPMNKLPQTG